MQAANFVEELGNIGVTDYVGVPDSTLRPFCDYINQEMKLGINQHVTANEGSAVGMAMGMYMASRRPVCVYMQNSGIGNAINPITSLLHEEVYNIPMLFLIGWRGEPGKKDEPQHKFMGNITLDILECLEIETAVIDENTSEKDLNQLLKKANGLLKSNKQFAIIAKKNTFQSEKETLYQNSFNINREAAVREILKNIMPQDVIVSTTGKISREVYEQSDLLWGKHEQDFLTVGGMGHASMIAAGLAEKWIEKKVYCIDGDGAALMHMGNIAFIGKQQYKNLVHICLNNEAHESVGGMPTGAMGLSLSKIAKECGYQNTYEVWELDEIQETLKKVTSNNELAFIEIMVKIGSREDLGRPKETAETNKNNFMEYHGEK